MTRTIGSRETIEQKIARQIAIVEKRILTISYAIKQTELWGEGTAHLDRLLVQSGQDLEDLYRGITLDSKY